MAGRIAGQPYCDPHGQPRALDLIGKLIVAAVLVFLFGNKPRNK